MERLRQRDLRLLLDVLAELAGEAAAVPFPPVLLAAVGRLVPGDVLSYNEVGPTPDLTTAVSDPPIPLILPGSDRVFARLAAEHPLVVHYRQTGDGRAVKLSDLLTRERLHRLELYQAIFRPLHLEHQMAISLPTTPRQVVGITVNRTDPDFSERDRTLLDLVRPYVAQAHRQMALLARLDQAMAARDHGVILLSPAGAVEFATARALAWLSAYFGPAPTLASLPDDVAAWVRARQICPDGEPLPLATPLVAARDRRRLVVDLLPGPSGATLLLREEESPDVSPAALATLGLTWREAEVLVEVARGRTAAEAADTLYVSRRTVQKHLEHAYRKLGVTNRAEAIAAIRQAHRLAEP